MSFASSSGAAPQAGAGSLTTALLGAGILLSGFAALSYQVAWQRALTQSIGSDALSVVLVVTIFMVWLGVGSFAARQLLRRPRLFFKNGRLDVPTRAVVPLDLARPWSRELPGVDAGEPVRRDPLQVMYFSGPVPGLQVDANTDDRPTFEYYWLRQRLGTWQSPREHLWDEQFNRYRRTIPVDVMAER